MGVEWVEVGVRDTNPGLAGAWLHKGNILEGQNLRPAGNVGNDRAHFRRLQMMRRGTPRVP